MADARSQGREGHQPINGISLTTSAPFPEYGDPLADARRAMDGDYSDLLHCDGLSVQLERYAAHGYGNAVVPQVAKAFIEAVMETTP